ncbi:protein of unknown function [Clostridium sp. USBA 49]|uniref:DUF4317 family protein n=1 Tax=Clostridium sp. USBA 49 TaxID=1881060 RepID=UPI0009999EFC|nr:DUF4317 family protein [Clostridium sp. USBA 49]SKA75266.1 protein of unknown function [Clostridium sp. USBA 49]
MNKKELNRMKKELKADSAILNINEIYSVYLKKDNGAIIYNNLNHFQMLDSEMQDFYFNNFKKILGGNLDTKLFELEFKDNPNETQLILNNMLKSQDKNFYIEYANKIIDKILKNYIYDSDIVITFVKGEYWKPSNNKNKTEIDGEDDIVQSLPFIMESINKVEPFKKTVVFNFEEKEFKASNILDTVINFNNPIEGFMFPSFDNGYSDINKILFYNSKPKELNYKFIENVLNCSMKLTAEEEKNCFIDIVKTVVGESIKTEVIEDIYSRITDMENFSDEDEEINIGLNDIKNILKDIGAKDVEVLDKVFDESCGKDYKFSAKNIVPNFKSKSLKVWNEDISISVNPKNLSSIKQVKGTNGERCLLIELNDDVLVEGFKLATEDNI